MEEGEERTCFAVFPGCYVEIILYLFWVNLFFFCVLEIDVTRNGNNLKLKVKSEFSLLSMGLANADKLILIYTVLYTVLCDIP